MEKETKKILIDKAIKKFKKLFNKGYTTIDKLMDIDNILETIDNEKFCKEKKFSIFFNNKKYDLIVLVRYCCVINIEEKTTQEKVFDRALDFYPNSDLKVVIEQLKIERGNLW